MSRNQHLMLYILVLAICVFMASRASASTGEHATPLEGPFRVSVQFKVKVMGLVNVTGRFRDVRSTVVKPWADTGSGYGIVIGATSIDTQHSARDAFIRSAAFFDVERYPTIRFSSARVQTGEQGTQHLVGDLTLHGVTRPVSFELIRKPGQSTDGAGTYAARTTIKRNEFGLGSVGMAVSNDVEITVVINEVDERAM